jgi:hypothetical protein
MTDPNSTTMDFNFLSIAINVVPLLGLGSIMVYAKHLESTGKRMSARVATSTSLWRFWRPCLPIHKKVLPGLMIAPGNRRSL